MAYSALNIILKELNPYLDNLPTSGQKLEQELKKRADTKAFGKYPMLKYVSKFTTYGYKNPAKEPDRQEIIDRYSKMYPMVWLETRPNYSPERGDVFVSSWLISGRTEDHKKANYTPKSVLKLAHDSYRAERSKWWGVNKGLLSDTYSEVNKLCDAILDKHVFKQLGMARNVKLSGVWTDIDTFIMFEVSKSGVSVRLIDFDTEYADWVRQGKQRGNWEDYYTKTAVNPAHKTSVMDKFIGAINENDYLEAPYNMMFDDTGAKAHPFLVYQGKLYVGDEDAMHANLLIQKFDSEDLAYSLDGRIWRGKKIITFWEWPKDVKSFLDKLVREAAKQQKIKIDLKTWKIEVKDPNTKKRIYAPVSDVLSKDTKLVKQGKSVLLKHLVSPMDKKHQPTPAGMGSNKRVRGSRGGESPVQSRYRLSLAEANQMRDKLFRMVAMEAYTSLIKLTKKKSSFRGKGAFRTIERNDGYPIFGVYMEDVNPRFDDLVFLVHPEDKSMGAFGLYNRAALNGKDIIDLFVIETKYLDALKAGKLDKSTLLSAILQDEKPKIIHELQHYLSINKRRGLPDNETGGKDIKFGTVDYYNDPEELNAYYQQGASNMEAWVKAAMNDSEQLERTKVSIPKSFNDFIRRVFNKQEKFRLWTSAYLDNLTVDNKKKFIKRVMPLHKKLANVLYSTPLSEAFRPKSGSITLNIIKNMDSAGNFGSRYGQDVEPYGTYVLEQYKDDVPAGNWKTGTVTFKKPYYVKVLEQTTVTWKTTLSSEYGGKKKKALTSAMKKDGYDGIITYDTYGTGEIIVFDNAKLKLN